MANRILRSYTGFSLEQYGNPWVTEVGIDGRIDFDMMGKKRVGYYTGGYNTGRKGDLIVYEPKNGQVYAYGQKCKIRKVKRDQYGNVVPQKSKDVYYAIYSDGRFFPCDKYGLLLDFWGMDKRHKKEYERVMG